MSLQRKVYLPIASHVSRDIEFDNLTYEVPFGKGKKKILDGICGLFKSGELTAIMGPSGAGKSSLLNILSGFQTNGTSGIIRCTGQEEKATCKVRYRKETCYILQDDRLCPLFTVGETMHFAAKLKIGESISNKSKQWLITNILETLGLENTRNTRCNRLSGGQKKRLSIALELIDNPPILFLDEPTTGLDSLSSYQCISTLKTLAKGGRTIVCTIHQPSASIYEMFDHVYTLAQGQCVYQGAALNTVPFLASVGLDCPQYHNPADHLIEVANCEYGNFNEQMASVIKKTNWRSVENSNNKMIEDEEEPEEITEDRTMVLVTPPSELYKFRVLLWRNMIQLYRDWTILHLRMLLHVLVGLFVGILYLGYGNDASKSIKNIGYYLVSIVYLSYTSMMPAVVKLPSEIPVVRKENFNNWYKLSTFYLSFLFVHTPVQVLFAVVYTLVSYFISGQLAEIDRLIMFTTMLVLSTLVAESIGVLFGTTVNAVNGTFMGAILTCYLLSVAGFLMLFTHMSKLWYIISYFSYMAYGMEGMVESTYRDRDPFPCPEDIIYCHYVSPDTVLEELGMNKGNYFYDMGFLLGHFALCKVLGFFTLQRSVKKATNA